MADVVQFPVLQPGERQEIEIDTDEHRVTSAAMAALARHPDVYQRSGSLVQVVVDSRPPKGLARPPGAPQIVHMKEPRIRELLSEQCDFSTWKSGGPKGKEPVKSSVHVPKWVPEQIMARGQWEGVRHLEAVSTTPFLRPDGSVVEHAGYDSATGVLLMPRVKFPSVADSVSEEHARKAVAFIKDVFVDFPFSAPEHFSCVIAGVLTPLARHAFHGPAPMVLIDKNVRGAGGSLLADVISACATGRGIARMVQSASDEEDKKRIFSIALAGDTMVLIDNITKPLGGAAIDAALTGNEIRDRVLGKSGMETAPLLACWFGTGNNVQVLGDTLRRILPVRIESQHEVPEERKGFKHDPLLPYAQQMYPRLAVAALTVLKGYVQHGRPDMKLSSWGSFEGWSNLVRQAVVWAGMTDPAKARQQLAEGADAEVLALRVIFENWRMLDHTGTGVSAASILDQLNSTDPHEQSSAMVVREAMMELAPNAFGSKGSARSLGKKLKHYKGRIIRGKALDSRTSNMGERWFMREVKSGD